MKKVFLNKLKKEFAHDGMMTLLMLSVPDIILLGYFSVWSSKYLYPILSEVSVSIERIIEGTTTLALLFFFVSYQHFFPKTGKEILITQLVLSLIECVNLLLSWWVLENPDLFWMLAGLFGAAIRFNGTRLHNRMVKINISSRDREEEFRTINNQLYTICISVGAALYLLIGYGHSVINTYTIITLLFYTDIVMISVLVSIGWLNID